MRVVDPSRGTHSAALQEIIKDEIGVKTGVKSRAELLFQDNTLTRLGAETFFSFTPGTRDMTLEQGTMLLQVPKGIGGAKIKTAAVTAAITGTTILMEYLPGRNVKVLVLEGSLRLSINGRLGEAVTLVPGRMILMKPDDKHLPEPVDVDLAKVMKTSTLVNTASSGKAGKGVDKPLPSLALIDTEIGKQTLAKGRSGLVETNLVIHGTGNHVSLASPEALTALDQGGSSRLTASLSPSLGGKTAGSVQGTIAMLGESTSAATDARDTTSKGVRVPITSSSGPATNPSSTSADGVGGVGGSSAPADPKGVGKTKPTPPPADGGGDSGPTSGDENNQGDGEGGKDSGKVSLPSNFVLPASSTTPATITVTGGFIANSKTVIDMGSAQLTAGGVSNQGGIFYPASANVLPADFLFGGTSAFDTNAGLNTGFGRRAGLAAAPAGVAVFRFNDLVLSQPMTLVDCYARPDLALISQGGISAPAGAGTAVNLDGLRSVFLGAQTGSITLQNDISIDGKGQNFALLEVYSRAANVSISGDVALPQSAFFVSAAQNVTFSGGGVVQPGLADLRAGSTLSIGKELSSPSVTLTAPIVSITAAMQVSQLNITADQLTTAVNLTAASGNLLIGTGGIQAGGATLTGSNLNSQGNVSAGTLEQGGSLQIGGSLSLPGGGNSTLASPTISIAQGIDGKGKIDSVAGANVSVLADQIAISSAAGGVNGINVEGADASTPSPTATGNGGTVTMGTAKTPIPGDVTINSPIKASSGTTGLGVLTAGNGGTVNVVSQGNVTVNSSVQVSDSTPGRATKNGGNIHLESRRTTGPAITISNSGQLLSLLSGVSAGKGGTIQFVSAGGDILVNGGTVQADRGTVDIRNNGPSGLVTLTNATLKGDVVKVGAFGPNGQLVVGGGVIDANTSLKLYAPGANGTVHFVNDVTLSGASTKIIAGNTVTIDNARTVTVGGVLPAQVYTNKANYSGSGGNGSTTGQFGGAGAVLGSKGLKGAPGY